MARTGAQRQRHRREHAEVAGRRQSWKRAWRVDVGEGYSSPVVAAGRAFVHSRRDPDELVTAIDLATGKVLVAAELRHAVQQEPVRDGGVEGAARDAARDRRPRSSRSAAWRCCRAWNTQTGALAWRKDYSASVDTSKLFTGTAASPLADGRSVIVQVGSDVTGGRVIALDPQTGAERWTWTRQGSRLRLAVVDRRRRHHARSSR